MKTIHKLMLMERGGLILSVGNFTQSLGAELWLNGTAPITFTGDNPDNWTVTGESGSDPEVTERAANAGHAGAGEGAVNFYSSATNNQPRAAQAVTAVGDLYELRWTISNRVSGGMASSNINPSGNNFAAASTFYQIGRSASTSLQLLATGAAPHDFTVSAVSLKKVTPNALQTIPADAIIDLYFVEPVSPVANQEIHLLYRVVGGASGVFLDCWDLILRRTAANNGWEIRLQSITAGTRGAGTTLTNIGANCDGIRVVVRGLVHEVFSRNGGGWTSRGSVTSTLHSTGTGVTTVYNSGFTPTALQVSTPSDLPYSDYIASLAPLLWYRLRETSGTAIASSGSIAPTSTWTAGDGALGQTGQLGANEAFDFDGLVSKIVIADNAAIQALATYTVVGLCKADAAGENNAGTIFHLGAGANGGFRRGGTGQQWRMDFDTDATDASSITDINFTPNDVWLCMFGTFDNAGDRTARIYKGVGGVVTQATYATQTPATGTRVTPVGAVVGNFSDVRTWDGLIDEVLVFNRVLTTAEMLQITRLMGV